MVFLPQILECEVPTAKDLERDVSLTVTVHLGNQTAEIGTIRIKQLSIANVVTADTVSADIIVLAVVLPVVVLLALSVVVVLVGCYCYKTKAYPVKQR